MSIYGLHFDGTTSVSAPPRVTITSFSVYNGNQINAYFQSAANAATGTHYVSVVTNRGTSASSSGSAATTVAVNMTKFGFTDSISYSRDCAGAASLISSPTWPAPTGGVVCPQKLGYTGDHAVYVSGATMHGTVTFSVSPAPSQGVTGMYVQGAIPGVGNFTASNVTMPAGQSSFQASVTASAALPSGQTAFYNPMNLAWSMAQSGGSCGSGCALVGSSSNPVYVTLAANVLPSNRQSLMLTYVALAVGPGGTTFFTAVNSTWSKFSSGALPANVSTWDGRLMFYYVTGVGFQSCALSAQQLVETNSIPSNNLTSGQCGAFAYLLESSLAANGIHSTWNSVTATYGSLLLVKNWRLANPGTYPSSAPWTDKLVVGLPDYMVLGPSGGFGDLANLAGIAGQNSSQPAEKIFNSHFIVQVGSTYYDPSYGATYSSPAAFESQALQGYAKQTGSDPPGSQLYHARPAVVSPFAVNTTFTPVNGNSM